MEKEIKNNSLVKIINRDKAVILISITALSLERIIFMFKFFKKKRDKNIEEAIEFIQFQRKMNKENIARFKRYNMPTTRLDEWDKIYKNILKMLKLL